MGEVKAESAAMMLYAALAWLAPECSKRSGGGVSSLMLRRTGAEKIGKERAMGFYNTPLVP
jgi:hypothetical protein